VCSSDLTVYVAGRTRNALGAGPSGGDGNLDAFVRAFDTDGATLWTRQFGDADNERASAVTLADDGSLIVASIEDGEGFVRKFSTADGTSPAVWEYALGDMDEGFISAVHADATGIYITGAARAGMTLASSPVAHSGARDAFVIALDDGANPTVRFETFIGSESEDVARDIVVADGAIYIAGYTDGEMPSGGELIGSRNGFVSKLDATTGSLAWSHQVAGRNGFSEGAALVYQSDGSSDLDVFGLPTGAMFYEDDNTITTRTSARAGDSFYVSVDGGRKRKIIIDADDSYRSLTFKINAVLVLDGKASVSRTSGGDKLMLKPQPGVKIEIFAGPDGEDVLSALGLEPGVVAKADDSDDAEEVRTFGLSLPKALDIDSRTTAESALKALEQAMTNVRAAYRHLTRDKSLDDLLSNGGKPIGKAPAHILAQIANYQNALFRLGG